MSQGPGTGIKLPLKFKTTKASELQHLSHNRKEKFIPKVGKEFRIGAGEGTYLVYEVCMINLGQLRFTCKLKEIQTVEMSDEQ